jgi:hypothetical protein
MGAMKKRISVKAKARLIPLGEDCDSITYRAELHDV